MIEGVAIVVGLVDLIAFLWMRRDLRVTDYRR